MESVAVLSLLLICLIQPFAGKPEVAEHYAGPPGKTNDIPMNIVLGKEGVTVREQQAEFEADDMEDEVVDAKIETTTNGEMFLELTSHGRTHKLNLVESRKQLKDIPIVIPGMSEEQHVEVMKEVEGIKMMIDYRYGATVAVKLETDGNVDPIVHSGVFTLGRHEFSMSKEEDKRVRISKRSIKDIQLSTDAIEIDLKREKRDIPVDITPINVTVEVVTIADYSMVQHFGNLYPSEPDIVTTLMLYLAHMVGMMNVHYSNMQNDNIAIDVDLAGIVVLSTPASHPDLTYNHAFSVGSDEYIIISSTLSRLSNWITSPALTLPYDHAMLFTNYGLSPDGSSSGILGVAYRGTICDPKWSISIIKSDHMHTYVASTATHELGHSLGSTHDNLDGCTDENYIMTAYAPTNFNNLQNFFLFSCCSQRAFYATIRQVNCLNTDTAMPDHPATINTNVANNLPGQIYDADDQCYMAYGTSACSAAFHTSHGLDICTTLFCVSPNNPINCHTAFSPAADGTACDVSEWCYRGQCVPVGTYHL